MRAVPAIAAIGSAALLLGSPAAAVAGTPVPAVAARGGTDGADLPVRPMAGDGFRPAPPGVTITFALAMLTPEQRAAARLARVSDPGDPAYRRFPDRDWIRTNFGADAGDVRLVARSAARAGMTARPDPTGVYVGITGTVREFSRWLNGDIVVQRTESRPNSRTVQQQRVFAATSGSVPSRVAQVARSINAVDVKLKTFAVKAAGSVSAQTRPIQTNEGTYLGGCRAARRQNTYSFAQLSRAYGGTGLSDTRATGKATDFVILSAGDGFAKSALRNAAECFDLPGHPVERVAVAGVKGHLAEGAEGNLDTQVAQAVLPAGSRITVIEGSQIVGAYPQLFAAAFALPVAPDVVSLSYGACEPLLGPGAGPVIGMTEAVLTRLALAGTTVAVSSGDDGSSGCKQGDGSLVPAVQYPGSSPMVASVGGSRITLTRDNTRRNEVVWRDKNRTEAIGGEKYTLPTVGGGGGSSLLFDRPWFQRGFAPGHRRGVPDLAMHASFGPGWPVYMSATAMRVQGGSGGAFQAVAGTSAATPFFAAHVAVMAGMERQQGRPGFGLIAPALYDVAETPDRVNPMFDITARDNDLYGVGCCQAGPGYDLASGLGSPDLARLYRALTGSG